MRRDLRTLLGLTAAAIAVPLVPWLAFGARLDHLVAGWLDPPPPPATLAIAEVGILAADILLPVPSSLVTTLGGANLGLVAGTACGWLGMTLGAVGGWWLGRATARRSAAGGIATTGERRRFGPLAVILTRPLPILAEAAALLAGGTGMPFREFLAAAAGANLAIAFAWSLAGALGSDADSLQWVLVASLAAPAALAWLVARGRPAETGH
jgi:uncharacterized membrane protein YdjX (TVP38/TMEM64 family)